MSEHIEYDSAGYPHKVKSVEPVPMQPAPSDRRLPVPIQPGEFEAEDGQRFNPIHVKPAAPQGSAEGEIKPHSSVIYTDLKVRCYGCQSQVIWRYDEKIDEILIVHDHARTTPQGSAAEAQLSMWSRFSHKEQMQRIREVEDWESSIPFWAGQPRDLCGPRAFAAAYAAHVTAEQRAEIERLRTITGGLCGACGVNMNEVCDLRASERKMQEALTSLRAFFANDPKGEYVLARADGNPLCLADRMVIAGRFIDSIDAALAAPDAPPEKENGNG